MKCVFHLNRLDARYSEEHYIRWFRNGLVPEMVFQLARDKPGTLDQAIEGAKEIATALSVCDATKRMVSRSEDGVAKIRRTPNAERAGARSSSVIRAIRGTPQRSEQPPTFNSPPARAPAMQSERGPRQAPASYRRTSNVPEVVPRRPPFTSAREPATADEDVMICHHCKREGHKVRFCPMMPEEAKREMTERYFAGARARMLRRQSPSANRPGPRAAPPPDVPPPVAPMPVPEASVPPREAAAPRRPAPPQEAKYAAVPAPGRG